MYNPARFQGGEEVIEKIVLSHPFATLLTPLAGVVEISHVPLVLEKRGGDWFLLGHLARSNPHWKALEQGLSTAIFHGPNAYVSPLWYEQCDSCDVPTWNYVVAHLAGPVSLLKTEESTIRALRALAAKTEGAEGWQFEIPADLAEAGALMKSIVGFELRVKHREAKLKLSQNRSAADLQGVMQGLSTRKDENSAQVHAWMQRLTERRI